MNPILISPKIESDKSVFEQLNQMKSYLYQFKENVELILANIDDANVSKQYENKLYNAFSREIVNSAGMSEVLQAAGIIKLTVKDVKDSVASLSLEVGNITAEISNPTTGILARLSVNENAISAEYTRATTAEGVLSSSISAQAGEIALKVSKANIVSDLNAKMSSSISITPSNIDISSDGALTINTTKFILDSNGNATFKGTIIGASGYIGTAAAGLGIEADGLSFNGYTALMMKVDENNNKYLQIGDNTYAADAIIAGKEVKAYCGWGTNSIQLTSDGTTVKLTDFIGNALFSVEYYQGSGIFSTTLMQVGSSETKINNDLKLSGDLKVNNVSKTPKWKDIDTVVGTGAYVLCGE